MEVQSYCLMRSALLLVVFLLLVAGCRAQDVAPVTVEGYGWQVERQKLAKPPSQTVARAREMTTDDKPFERRVREAQQRGSMPDPSDEAPDGRRAQIDKMEAQANTLGSNEIDGYVYRVLVRNNTDKAVKVLYWEYMFTEIADPKNVVRRQFLCSVNIRPGDKKDLSVFSALGPSQVVSADTLMKSPDQKRFKEVVFINRVELSDDNILQRREWKYGEVKKAVDRATSAPWSPNEVCRVI